MIQVFKQWISPPSPLEMAAREMIKAQREKLEAESAREYAAAMVMYHDARIARLYDRLHELKEQA